MARRLRVESPAGALVLAALGWMCPGAAMAQAPVPDSPAIESRVNQMMARLTLEEKIDLIGGVDRMFIRAAPAAGFPRLKMSDGPLGVRTWGPATAYAGGIALAATWDPALAERVGASIGEDARARGVHFLLGPGVNIYRAPMNGRNFEYFGEDPFLSGRIAVGYIEGVQSRGVVATVKHFAANNSEYDRHNTSADMDERTLREIYLPAFEAAVREAHAGAVMNSYNRINGVHATQNNAINVAILKGEWGFDGILMSDWTATYDGPAAANAGLDLEMPRADFMNRENLLPAVQSGAVPLATIDDKVRRIFRTAVRFGFLDREQADPGIPLYNPRGRELALDAARESIVLLQNRDGLLPLDRERIHVLAVIGPDASPAVPGGGGSSRVDSFGATSILAGVAECGGSAVRTLYARGLPAPRDVFHDTVFDPVGKGPGVRVESFENPDFAGEPVSTRFVAAADQWRSEMFTPHATKRRSVRWSARFTPAKSGSHLFLAAAGGEDAYTLYVDGAKLIEQHKREGQVPRFAEMALEAGRSVDLRLDYLPDSDHDRIGFGIAQTGDLISGEARKIAAAADAVVVCAGFDPDSEGEGFDRSFTLPWGQDALISAVAAINPRTIVAITAGGGVDMRRWIPAVPAVLHAWYPGERGGTALAEILFGLRSPEGRLPASFERSWEENPVHDHYYPAAGGNPADPHVPYAEGVFVGYRYYTSMGRPTLFPFGFGMTYTAFSFGRIEAPAAGDSDSGVTVGFDVTNTGRRAGADVAQLYVGDPSARLPRPVKELKGFQKIRLEPGETRRVTFRLDRRAFAYFDAEAHKWRVDPGRFILYAGDSSENTPLQAEVVLAR